METPHLITPLYRPGSTHACWVGTPILADSPGWVTLSPIVHPLLNHLALHHNATLSLLSASPRLSRFLRRMVAQGHPIPSR
ncbi:hypothetical protein [Rubritalea tangerina]|uniref:hypothetical protein n=1 Tax=Rubritalea tangerina TaxID=430798 RepID=UPI00361B2D34